MNPQTPSSRPKRHAFVFVTRNGEIPALAVAVAIAVAVALAFAVAFAFAVAPGFASVLAFSVAFLSVIPAGNLLSNLPPLRETWLPSRTLRLAFALLRDLRETFAPFAGNVLADMEP